MNARNGFMERPMNRANIGLDETLVRLLLAYTGWEVRDLAAIMGFDKKYVSNILTGQNPVSKKFCVALGQAFSVAACGVREAS